MSNCSHSQTNITYLFQFYFIYNERHRDEETGSGGSVTEKPKKLFVGIFNDIRNVQAGDNYGPSWSSQYVCFFV